MFKKYFTTTLRHLWKQRLFTGLNVMGLAVSISVCWLVYRIVNFEYSYEKGFKKIDQTYRVVSGFIFDEKESYNGGVSKPIYQELRKTGVGFDRVVPVFGMWMKTVVVNDGSGKLSNFDDVEDVVAIDSSYFDMIDYQWLAGFANSALKSPNSLVLTESRAKQYFPNKKIQEVLNQSITYITYRDTTVRTVTGVVADLKGNTEFTGKEFCALKSEDYPLAQWTNTNGSDKLYVQLNPNYDEKKALAVIENMVQQKTKEHMSQKENSFKFTRWMQLLPLKESHFSTYIQEWGVHKANKKVLFGLIGIAAFLLLLAIINYVNMSVASIPHRAKEIGVRKTLGSGSSTLILQFLIETLMITVLASIVAYFLGQVEFRLLKDIIPEGVESLDNTWLILVFMLCLTMVVSLLAGLYPGWLITKVKTVNVFKTAFVFKNSKSRVGLQKALIVFQFMIAIVFITGAIVMGKQLNYIVHSDMGFNKEAVVLVNIPFKFAGEEKYKGKPQALLGEFKTLPGVVSASLGTPPLQSGYSSSHFKYFKEGKEPIERQLFKKYIDTSYMKLYGFQLIAGRALSQSDTTNELVINETAVKAYGFASPQEAIGKMLGQSEESLVPIVGVVKDFHAQSFYNSIDPLGFMMDAEGMFNFNIKLSTADMANWQKTLSAIERKWYQFYPPDTFKYEFYDDSIAAMYKTERSMVVMINLVTGIAILISCLGLFGLAVLTAHQRTKEIGIRKVLGASVSGIVALLSKDYLKLVIIAIMVATPLSWWAMNTWLRDFAYKIPLSWWLFAVAGILGLVVAFLTVSFHALKAANENPVKSLKTE
ncbi:MAG: ABC transporter permease [Chitinophagaceae bacterium]|nr:ABC transporter permease [Chitinophagaceae bacterium]